MKYSIRASNDLDVVHAIHEKCFPLDDMYRSKKYDSIYWLVTNANRRKVGFAQLTVYDRSIVFMSRSGLLECARGVGLHYRLIKVRENWARKRGYRTMITYTMKDNLKSFCSLIRYGYEIYTPEYQYAGKDIYYFRKEL